MMAINALKSNRQNSKKSSSEIQIILQPFKGCFLFYNGHLHCVGEKRILAHNKFVLEREHLGSFQE